jgi:hypothetical protein
MCQPAKGRNFPQYRAKVALQIQLIRYEYTHRFPPAHRMGRGGTTFNN